MKSTHDKETFDLIVDTNRLWSTLAKPCPAGITSTPMIDQTVRAGP